MNSCTAGEARTSWRSVRSPTAVSPRDAVRWTRSPSTRSASRLVTTATEEPETTSHRVLCVNWDVETER
jgi:hypothetical protein